MGYAQRPSLSPCPEPRGLIAYYLYIPLLAIASLSLLKG